MHGPGCHRSYDEFATRMSKNRSTPMPFLIRLAVLMTEAAFITPSFAADLDWSQVGKALGKAGSLQSGRRLQSRLAANRPQHNFRWCGAKARVCAVERETSIAFEGLPENS